MKTIFQIARSEFRTLFCSPIAWFVLLLFTFQLSMGFTDMLTGQIKNAYLGQPLRSLTSQIYVNGFGQPLFGIAFGYLYLFIPLLTMRMMSSEYSSGSIKLLFSSPITSSQIILGKFLSMMYYGLILVLILAVYVVFGLFAVKSLDFCWLLGGLLGIYLLICLYSAIGIFISSLTSYQVVAAIGSIAALMLMQQVGGFFQGVDFVRDIFNWFGIGGHGMVAGMITSGDLLYYILVSGMFLTFSILVLYFKRNRKSLTRKIVTYASVFVITGLIGYATSRPSTMFFRDITRHKQLTITDNSKDILAQFPGELKITSYVNILDSHQAMSSMPKSRIGDMNFMNGYRRFKPGIRMEYVYFYDELLDGHGHHDCCSADELEAEARAEAKTAGMSFRKVLKPAEIRELIDLSGEGNAFVRQIEYEGRKTWLRMYQDLSRYPGEQEITDALQVLLTRRMRVGMLTGHGETGLHDTGDRGYAGIYDEGTSRGQHINHGCDILSVPFGAGRDIPDDLDMLFISDVKIPFTAAETARLQELVDAGQNMVINVDLGSRETMAGLLAMFKVGTLPGTLIEEHEDYAPTLIIGQVTPGIGRIGHGMERHSGRNPITMSGAVGLTFTDGGPFLITPYLMARPTVWNEIEQSDFEENPPVYNSAKGEIRGSFFLGLILTRDVNGKEQRVVVNGDSDWMSRSEISKWRGFGTANAAFASNMVWWQTGDNYPIDTSRPAQPDNEMKASFESRDAIKWGFRFFFPLVWAVGGIVVWVRRRGK